VHGGGISKSGAAVETHIPSVMACFGCSDSAAALLVGAMSERRYPARSNIALRGDAASQFFLVLEGAVVAEIFGIDGQQAQLARHGPGEIFGAYPQATSYRADMRSMVETQLLSIPTADLARLAHDHAEIGAGIAGLLARQLDLMLDRMASRLGLSANGRFHKALLQLADADGQISPAPVISALALSVHTTRETGSRALAALLRRGIVERQDNALRIVSRRMLEEMVV
jgi:CRP/FNR family transcriptional regulator, cyclic AMP receptor protein